MSNKIQPPLHGPYLRRAEVLAQALGVLIQKEYGDKLLPIRRGSDQNLVIRWELPVHVQVVIKKSAGGADPSIWIHRNDPTGTTAVGTDWKNDECGRVYEDKCYDLDAVAEKISKAVAYNRERGDQLESNSKAMLSDLEGTQIPKDVAVSRNPQTGKYTIRHTVALDELTVKDAKSVLGRIGQVLGIVKPAPKAASPVPAAKPPVPAAATKPAQASAAPASPKKEDVPKTS